MDRFTKALLAELAGVNEPVAVSLFMPTNHVESEFAQNPIRLKNLLKHTRAELKERGLRDSDIDELLEPAASLLDNAPYWRTVNHGMALFLTPSMSRIFRLPIPFEEIAVTSRRFHLKPLFPLIASNKRFYVLSISRNEVKLCLGTLYNLTEIESKQIPSDIQEALWYDENDGSRNRLHSGPRYSSTHGSAKNFAQYTAHGGESDDLASGAHETLLRYFREIDSGVVATLDGDQSTPLLLAGVNHYLPIYREANTYAGLMENEIVSGNPDGLPSRTLHEKAWKIMEPAFRVSEEKAIAEFKEVYHTDASRASDDLKEIVPAAFFSRVDTLFVPVGKYVWGKYDPTRNTVVIHDHQEPGDEDLLNAAALQTYLNGGTVHALDPEKMPVEDVIAARFRFPASVKAGEVA